MESTSKPLTVLITGANRGIGLCILQRLLLAFPGNSYLLGSRDAAKGTSALDELRSKGILSDSHKVTVLSLDTGSTSSINAAADTIQTQHNGRLDVLINNAGIATAHPADSSDLDALHEIWRQTFSINVFAPHMLFQAFLPFLRASDAPRVINISSGRGSLIRSTAGKLPPTAVLSYSVSKVALNGLGVEMDKILDKETGGKGRVWAANPGHCKTAFNGYRGTRDPIDGAGVVEVLLKRDVEGKTVVSGFWEEEGGKLTEVPW